MENNIKKYIIILIRKLIYISLVITKFPFIKSNSHTFLEIKEKYENKPVAPILNRTFPRNQHLTIIVPVYNAEKTIDYCLKSLMNQKTQYIYSVVVVNDGSTDGTNVILKKYEETYKNIIVVNQENRGISEARNTGLRYVTGDYIGFVDNDDYVSENYVELLLNNAYETGADIVRCNYYEYDIEKDKCIKSGKDQSNIVIKDGLKDKILEFKGYPWAGIYMSTLWEDIGFPKDYWCEDMIIRMIVYRKSRIFSYINDKLYYHCLHGNNTTKSRKTADVQCLDHFFLIQKLCQLSNDIGLVNDYELCINALYEYSVVLWLRTRKLDKELRKQVFEESCKIIEQIIGDQEKLSKEQQLIASNIKRRDYTIWKLYSI